VCVEGIETEDEALCATDANADLVQGHYFAGPAATLPDEEVCRDMFQRLFAGFRTEASQIQARRRTMLEPYFQALSQAARSLARGESLVVAGSPLLELPCTQRCYRILSDGSQLGGNLESERVSSARDVRLEPMLPTPGTNWQNKPYFRRAMGSPGAIQVTRPYLSITGPKLCMTLSLAYAAVGMTEVICADLDFAALAGEKPAA
jgi:hypothetical protein